LIVYLSRSQVKLGLATVSQLIAVRRQFTATAPPAAGPNTSRGPLGRA